MNSMVGHEYLQELGLSPLWVLRHRSAASVDSEGINLEEAMVATLTTTGNTASSPSATSPVALTPPPASVAKTEAIIQRMDWDMLRQTASRCHNCGLGKTRQNVVFGVGDRQADIMFIGEGPGGEEDRRGEPFVGRAGQLLDMMLHAVALSRRQSVYIANIVKCRPPDNRNPTHEEARACLAYLQRQISLVQPRLLVALGKVAASQLLQTETSISQLRQKLHDYQGIPLIVTYHPAYLLRSPQEKRKSWDDLRFARRLLREERTDE